MDSEYCGLGQRKNRSWQIRPAFEYDLGQLPVPAFEGLDGLGAQRDIVFSELPRRLTCSARANWGIRDFSDLKRFIGIAADLGASAVGLNPLHAMFLDAPEQASLIRRQAVSILMSYRSTSESLRCKDSTAYIEQLLAPSLRPGDTVVMDNFPAHKVHSVRSAIQAAGESLLYLASYSRDFNPIGMAFSKLKGAVAHRGRAHHARSLASNRQTFSKRFSPDECQNYLAALDTTQPDRKML